MRKLLLSFAVAAAFVASPAMAQEGAVGPDGGSWELRLGGGGSNDNDLTETDFNVNGTLGYYLDPNWMVSVQQGVDYSDVGMAGSAWNGSTRVGIDYHFDVGGDLRPYLGANLGYIYGDSVNDSWLAAGQGGLKWYVKQETFIFGQAEYQWLFDEGNDATDSFDDGRFVFTLGIGFNF